MSIDINSTLFDDFKGFTQVIFDISDYIYIFKSINCLDKGAGIAANSYLPTIAIILIGCLMLLTILKTLMIYLSYYCVIIPKTVFTMIHTVIKTKGKIRLQLVLTKIGKTALSHLQTFYSYNFYSYTEPVGGVILMFLYLIFIVMTMMMSLMYFLDPQLGSDSISQHLIYIFGFLSQLFLQIYLPFFYYTRKENKFSFFFTVSFTFWFFLLGMLSYIFNQKSLEKSTYKDIIYMLFSLGLHMFLLGTTMLSIKKMLAYSLNKKSIRMMLFEEEEKKDEEKLLLSKATIRRLSKKYRLNNYYSDSSKDHFFDMSDRFKRKKILLFCFILYAIDNLCVILFLALIKKYPTIMKTALQIGLLIESVILNIVAWNTFMKLEISRVYLY